MLVVASTWALAGQDSTAPPNTDASSASQAGQKPADQNQKPEEEKKKENPPAGNQAQPQIRLENPQPAAPPEGNQKQQAQPPAQPGQLKLEAPKLQEAKPGQPEQPPKTAPPRTDIVAGIRFVGLRRIPANVLRARIFTHVGDAYDENALERDFLALWNTGYFDDIRFERTDTDKGIMLAIIVREKKLVRSIDYKGLSSVQQSDVLDRFKERKVGLTIQSQYDPVVVKRAEVVLQDSWRNTAGSLQRCAPARGIFRPTRWR